VNNYPSRLHRLFASFSHQEFHSRSRWITILLRERTFKRVPSGSKLISFSYRDEIWEDAFRDQTSYSETVSIRGSDRRWSRIGSNGLKGRGEHKTIEVSQFALLLLCRPSGDRCDRVTNSCVSISTLYINIEQVFQQPNVRFSNISLQQQDLG